MVNIIFMALTPCQNNPRAVEIYVAILVRFKKPPITLPKLCAKGRRTEKPLACQSATYKEQPSSRNIFEKSSSISHTQN